MKETVEEQSRCWENLIEKQQAEEKQLNNQQVEQQCITFQQLLLEAQKQRKKDIEARQKKLDFPFRIDNPKPYFFLSIFLFIERQIN